MNLEVLLPYQVLLRRSGVSRIVAETDHGSFGLLPHRLDCVAALVPGILSFESDDGGELFVGIDEGVLVKTGDEVRVSVRRALLGRDLAQLRDAVAREFASADQQAQELRALMTQLETGFLARFARLRHD